MCIAYTAKVVSVSDDIATVEVSGKLRDVILLALQGDPPVPGEWLLVQSGLALSRLNEEELNEYPAQ